MKRYMVCFTSGQFIKLLADNLREGENNDIVFSIDEKVIGVFNWNNIAGWVIIEEEVEII